MGKVFIWQERERIDESGGSKGRGCVAGLMPLSLLCSNQKRKKNKLSANIEQCLFFPPGSQICVLTAVLLLAVYALPGRASSFFPFSSENKLN